MNAHESMNHQLHEIFERQTMKGGGTSDKTTLPVAAISQSASRLLLASKGRIEQWVFCNAASKKSTRMLPQDEYDKPLPRLRRFVIERRSRNPQGVHQGGMTEPTAEWWAERLDTARQLYERGDFSRSRQELEQRAADQAAAKAKAKAMAKIKTKAKAKAKVKGAKGATDR
mmetsp:Transcript_26216/g.75208  ORF Transcript_26216/g.75208 Transcript_26216/m.75208 type:complete len:171 (-) Transcript_26216:62-574(-)